MSARKGVHPSLSWILTMARERLVSCQAQHLYFAFCGRRKSPGTLGDIDYDMKVGRLEWETVS